MNGRVSEGHNADKSAIEEASSLKGLLIACCIAAFIWAMIGLMVVNWA